MRSMLRFAAELTPSQALLLGMAAFMRKPTSLFAIGCTLHDGHFWIPDAALLTIDYLLELELQGHGPGFGDEPSVAWLKNECPGIGALFKHFLRWLGGDVEPTKGWILPSSHLLAYPGHAVPVTPRLATLIDAWRRRPQPTAAIVSTTAAPPANSFLTWRSLSDLTRLPQGRDLLAQCATPTSRLDTCQRSGLIGLSAALASTGATNVPQGLRALFVDAISWCARNATYDNRRLWTCDPIIRGCEPFVLCRTPQGLAIHGSCLSTLLLFGKLCSRSWRENDALPVNWPYQVLIHGGWRDLIDDIFPLRLRGGGVRLELSDAPWFVLPELPSAGEPITGPWQPDHSADWYLRTVPATDLRHAVPPE